MSTSHAPSSAPETRDLPAPGPAERAELRAVASRADGLQGRLVAAAAAPGLAENERARLDAVTRRLARSVARPLWQALADLDGTTPSAAVTATADEATADEATGDEAGAGLGEALWQLAHDLTVLRLRPGLPATVQEATAALQDLAVRLAGTDEAAAARLVDLRRLQSDLPRGIRSSENGPYLATNVEDVTDWLGRAVRPQPQMALCRCGASSMKPFCDGTHAEIGFRGQKDAGRLPDRQDSYQGLQVTVLDNRGTCAHSGFCTDRLAMVFRLGEEPFVAPSGGRMDEIVRAVRACPSGALSYAIDGAEARAQVDQPRPPSIEVSKDGPYRVTGGIPLADAQGGVEHRNEGASAEHYSLCRCGQSQNKPFCSGRHWTVSFKDPVPSVEEEPTLFEWAGGYPALLRMTSLFYSKFVPEEPMLAPLFARMAPDHPERVAAWLSETFGGGPFHSSRYGGYLQMVCQHMGKQLTERQRSRWVQLMVQAADESGLPADAEFRAAFVSYIEWGSRLAIENSQIGAHPPSHMPVPRWWWVCNATPGSRVSALAPPPENEVPIELPVPGEPVSFAHHVKALFRKVDRESMVFAFDLWSHDDVSRHAQAIFDRLEKGTMPCDKAWPPAKVEVFRRWMESGTPA